MADCVYEKSFIGLAAILNNRFLVYDCLGCLMIIWKMTVVETRLAFCKPVTPAFAV